MKRIRIIPVLLLMKEGLYKTVRFSNPSYVGDPINAVKIFNEKEADELVILDITASKEKRRPNFSKLAEIAGEAFMPMGYGGGIQTFDDAQKVFDTGFEKVIINTAVFEYPNLIREIAKVYGAQSVVVSIDAKLNWWGNYEVYSNGGTRRVGLSPEEASKKAEANGAGEIFINAIHKDGTWSGYDLKLIQKVSSAVNIPVVACGGASSMMDFKLAITEGGVSAVAAGSMFVYQKKGMGVLISFPTEALEI